MDAQKHERFADKVMAISMLITSIFTVILAVLFYVKFEGCYLLDYYYDKISKITIFRQLSIISGFLALFGLMMLIFKLHHTIVRCLAVILGIITAMVICIYTQFDFILVFIIPVIAASLYYSKKFTFFTEILTLMSIFLSYLFACQILKIYIPYENGFKEVILKLFLPNTLVYFFIAFLFNNLATETSILKKMSFQNSRTINAQNSALDDIINNSLEIFGASSLDDFDNIVKATINELVTPFLQNKGLPIRTSIGHVSGKDFIYADDDKILHKAFIGEDFIRVNLGIRNVDIALKRHDSPFTYYIQDDSIIVSFFNNNSLIHFFVVDALINPSETLEEIIKILANNIGIALRNLRLNLDLLDSQAEMIYSFSKVTDSRSHYTGNHIKRVSEYMRVLAIGAGYSNDHASKISIASMMHDIGKILIPLEILEKNSNLSDKEYEIMKTHTTKGVDLIKNCPGDIMNMAKIMIREHHERWDGKGYQGIPGQKIHTISRLITVADVFDALISSRPYKEAWPADKVRQTIVSESGTHFDPRIVSIFVKHFDELVEIYEQYKD